MADEIRPSISPARVERLFDGRHVAGADDFLQREVGRRMMERLSSVRLDARQVLDLGCGDGGDLGALRARFPEASVCGVDATRSRLVRAQRRRTESAGMRGWLRRWLRREAALRAVQADFGALPFAAGGFDVLWSNLALHWSAEPHRVLPEWSRVARVGALVAFSAFGPDTLAEVREAFRTVDTDTHAMAFTDMHDYGDMLIAAGFTTPVVDVERLTLTYSTPDTFWSDVRALGGNPSRRAAAGLNARAVRRRLDEALEATRDDNGRYRLTFELIFAHAWKGEARMTRDGDAIVRFDRLRP
jgi:malonyl-CoA O-methyltransferase